MLLDEFMNIICGEFDNHEQFACLKEEGFPYAEHVNTRVNNKIINLPNDFNGEFIIEESYYTINDRQNQSMHLFLFSEVDGNICLKSYDIPSQFNKQNFTYDNVDQLDYHELKMNEKFTPTIFTYEDEKWKCYSESMFSPVTKFILEEEFSKDQLVVSETIMNNDKRTFGFDYPIIYKRKIVA